MKTLDEHLNPNTHLSLPITIWQVFDEIEPIDKDLKARLHFGWILIVFAIGLWIYQADAPIFLLAFFSSVYLPYIWFCVFHFRYFNLKDNTPLPIITISNHSVQLYDNNGQMMIDNKLVSYYETKAWVINHNVRWLSFGVKNQSFWYFLFDNKVCRYYLDVNNETYQIHKESLKKLIESIILEVKKNPNREFVEFNKRYYVNGY